MIPFDNTATKSPAGMEILNGGLSSHYKQKAPLIRRSLSALFPKKCTNTWLKTLTSREDLPWDVKTLQSSFLDPVNQYLRRKRMYRYALGGILLLESSKINLEPVLPLLSINEALEACFRLFKDIGIHDHQSYSSFRELGADNSIKANAGVALLTLPYYPVLHNYCHLDEDSRLWLLQNATQSILGVFYANGAQLYRRHNKVPFALFEEYKQSAFLMNGPKLGFTFNLWLALAQHFKSPRLVQLCKEASMAFSLSCQLSKDLANFRDWLERHSKEAKVTFWDTNNFIAFCIARASQQSGILSKPLSPATIIALFNDSGAENDIANCIYENKVTISHIVGELPLEPGHRSMLMAYIQWLLEDMDISYEG